MKQHREMCSSNWICTKLQLAMLQVEDEGNDSEQLEDGTPFTPSPKIKKPLRHGKSTFL